MKNILVLALTATLPVMALTQTQVAHADDVPKNELGMITVHCQVVENAPGNPIIGFVVGNHPSELDTAKKDANLYESKFGGNAHKRHCYPQKRYKPSGAYDMNWNPK